MRYINLSFASLIPNDLKELPCKLKHFSCGEFEFGIEEGVSNQDITIFQSFTPGKFNDDLVKLQIVCDVLKRNNVNRIIYVAPFLPYTRQDRTYETTASLGSKLVAEIVNYSGIQEIITYDLHALQIEGFFRGRVQNLSMIPRFIAHIKENFDLRSVVIIFPDSGSAARCKRFFANEEFEIAIINKQRACGEIKMQILGSVAGKITIIVDDMIDSGSTLIEASKLLLARDAKSVFVYATHGIFSDNAIDRLDKSEIKKVVVSDSLPQKSFPIIEVLKIIYE